MPIPKTPLLVIFLVFLSVIGFAYLVSTNPLWFGQILDITSEHEPSDEAILLLGQQLSIGKEVGLALPVKSVYSPGDAFSALLGINNWRGSDTSFHVSIYKSSGPDISPVLIYDRQTPELKPLGIYSDKIAIITYPETSPGRYTYTVAVCTQEPCTMDSAHLYSHTYMNFEVRQ